MILATKSDMEMFIHEKSPHVKSVEIDNDNDDNVVYIKIKLQFWYRFFYENTFYKFIVRELEDNKLYGVILDVTIIS